MSKIKCSVVPYLLLLVGLVSLIPTVTLAQSRTGTTAASFLTIGTGARGQALGHAYTAMATGADALFWNPAGAARSYEDRSRGGAFLSHSRWFADITYNAASVVIPVYDDHILGLSVASVNYGDMIVRTVAFPRGNWRDLSINRFQFRPYVCPAIDRIVLLWRYRKICSSANPGYDGRYYRLRLWIRASI